MRKASFLGQNAGSITSSIGNMLLVLVLLVICLTPVLFFPEPDVRKWLYRRLATSRPFARTGYPDPNVRSLGMVLWDWTRVYWVVGALLFLPVAAPVVLGFWLFPADFGNDTQETAGFVQILVTALIGGIAVDVFLSGQLQRLGHARVTSTFLLSVPDSRHGDQFVERYERSEEFKPGQLRWVHLRITNVGVVYYSAFTVSCEIPPEWTVPFSIVQTMSGDQPLAQDMYVRETEETVPMASYARALRWVAAKHQIDFPPRSDPRDTGPGATAVYSFLLRAPESPTCSNYPLRIKVSAGEAGGAAIDDLTLLVRNP